MKVIFHVGMGKTGTSSVQKTLERNEAVLTAKKINYLGMWMDVLSPDFVNPYGLVKQFSQPAAKLVQDANTYADFLEQRAKATGAETFILSNEGLFERPDTVGIFLKELEKRAEVQVIAYIRDPRAWLPSAHTQWSLRHKAYDGPIQGFAERAPFLLKMYDAARVWAQDFPGRVIMRDYEKCGNVVQDFSDLLALDLEAGGERVLERDEPVVTLLRALYNDRMPGHVLPEQFSRVVLSTAKNKIRSVDDMADQCFDTSAIEDVIAEKSDLFEFLRQEYDMDFLSNPRAPKPAPSKEDLHARLLDALVELTLDQSLRITRLERALRELKKTKA